MTALMVLDQDSSISGTQEPDSPKFGLTVMLKRTKVMLQASSRLFEVPPVISDGNIFQPTVKKFCYLGSTMSHNASLYDEICARIAKASSSFGRPPDSSGTDTPEHKGGCTQSSCIDIAPL